MSRVGKNPVPVPSGVDVTLADGRLVAKGPKGESSMDLHPTMSVVHEDGELRIQEPAGEHRAMAGTTRALMSNLVTGVSEGFERRLTIVGVGYRAQVQGAKLNLSLGFSHPVVYEAPEGVNLETPSQTEIVVRGVDKQRVGQTAAEIRRFRPPEPYKGKGVRYSDEHVVRKQAKKK